jgi:peptidoglycan L-alanyl-D-glutamate endopeptidase CwlK
MLRDRGAPFLADTLTLVAEMRTPGRWATNLLPGSSWHQFGEAIDLVVESESGLTVWSRAHPDYATYAAIAEEVGLHHGLRWKRPDAIHTQLRSEPVRAFFSWAELDALTHREQEQRETSLRPTSSSAA